MMTTDDLSKKMAGVSSELKTSLWSKHFNFIVSNFPFNAKQPPSDSAAASFIQNQTGERNCTFINSGSHESSVSERTFEQ